MTSINMFDSKSKSSSAKKEFNPASVPEAGTQVLTLIQVIDLGVQERKAFRDKRTGLTDQKPPARMVRLTFELPNDLIETDDGMKPKLISIEFPVSSNDKSRCYNWYKVFDVNLSEGGDWAAMVGKACMGTITHDKGSGSYEGWTFAKLSSIAPLMRGMNAPDAVNPLLVYSPSSHNQEVFDQLPDFIKDKINGRLDRSGETSAQSSTPTQQSAKPAPKLADTYQAVSQDDDY